MQRANPCWIVFIGLLLIAVVPGRADEWSRVAWVSDGDTIGLVDGRKVRYLGIDAPEIRHGNQAAQPGGEAARRLNRRLVDGRPVRLVFDRERQDRYGRLLAYVFLSDGRFVNREILAAGMAVCLPQAPNDRFARVLLEAQRHAMTVKRGIWIAPPEAPQTYVGNRRSLRFHRPACPLGQRIAAANRSWFADRRDAFWRGYAPCRRCAR